EPSLLKSYSHGSRKYVGSFHAHTIVRTAVTVRKTYGQRSVAFAMTRVTAPWLPSSRTFSGGSRSQIGRAAWMRSMTTINAGTHGIIDTQTRSMPTKPIIPN